MEAFEKGQFKKAKDYFAKVIEIVPYEPSSRVFMARCHAKLGNSTNAIQSLAQAGALGWEDANSLKSYDEFQKLLSKPAFKNAIKSIDGNRTRKYVLYIGKSVNRAKAAPMIVLYHGHGELPQIQLHFWKQAADRAGWHVLALKGTQKLGAVYTWSHKNARQPWLIDQNAIVVETKSRIDEVRKSNKVSTIVLAGFSQGGVAVMEMLRSQTDLNPSGAIIFASAFPGRTDKFLKNNSTTPKCPVLIHVGKSDPWYKGNLAVTEWLKKNSVAVNLKTWDGLGHQMPPNHTQVILDSVKNLLETKRENFTIAGCKAFVLEPPKAAKRSGPMPWVWYAPTLPGLPGKFENWMFERFHRAGIAIAGIDVGESYGNPKGRAAYQKLFDELTKKRGYSKKPVLLARSRGGLMLYNWAVEHPESVGGIAGIYPVCNIASYPGINARPERME